VLNPVILMPSSCLSRAPPLATYIRARGDLPEKPQDDQNDQTDDGDKITPIRPVARNRINAKRTEREAAMIVGGRTLRRNPLPHEIQAAADYDAMEQAWQSERASLVEQWKADVKTAHQLPSSKRSSSPTHLINSPRLKHQSLAKNCWAIPVCNGRGCRHAGGGRSSGAGRRA
jgi:hypothetical protein